MSSFRSALFLCTVTALATAALLFFGSVQGYEKFNGGYAVLKVDTLTEEEHLLELLEAGKNNLTGVPISESTQWVLLDEFGSLQKIPLDKYSQRLLPFDPRNDGYAEKLKKVFESDGKRNIYIPLNTGSWNAAMLDKHFKDLLKDIYFTIDYYGIVKPVYLYFIFYFASSIGLLIICYVKKIPFSYVKNILTLIPVLSPLSFFGACGIVSAGIIFGFFVLMREPFGDLVKLPSLFSGANKKMFGLLYKEILKPYKMYWSVLPVFAASSGIIIVFSQIKLLFLLIVFICSLAMYLFSCKTVVFLYVSRKRFNPILIIKKPFPDFTFSVCMSPFAIFAILVIFVTPYITGKYTSNEKYNIAIDETDYLEHLIYQSAFSISKLGTSITDFQNYTFDEDGLLVKQKIIEESINIDGFPSFPLGHLTNFFNNINDGWRKDTISGTGEIEDKICISALLILIILGFFIKKENKKSINFTNLNKFNSNIRYKGINRNKTIMYNSKNELLIRRDA
jgi:hypothetical protein